MLHNNIVMEHDVIIVDNVIVFEVETLKIVFL